jgi:excisionase family DNA binding protein
MNTTEHVGYLAASKILGVPTGTLYSLVSRRAIPHIRIGKRHVLFNVVDLRQWLDEHKVIVKTVADRKGVTHEQR